MSLKSFLGKWRLCDNKSILAIDEIGETYKCTWRISSDGYENEYLGIGMLINNKIFVSKFSKNVPKGGIGIYNPINNFRYISSSWASTQNFGVLGSGFACKQDMNKEFKGDYKIKYFIKENQSQIYDLNIRKSVNDKAYFLKWSIDEEEKLHGLGIVDNGTMILSWGEIEFKYELVILNIEKDCKLRAKYILLENNILEETYIKH